MNDIGFIEISIYEILTTLIYIINFIAIMNLVFREKRSIDTTFVWIIILSIAPAFGFILYIAFGRSIAKENMFKIKEEEDQVIKSRISQMTNRLEYDESSDYSKKYKKYKDMIYTLTKSNNAHFSTNNDIELYTDSQEFFDTLLQNLRDAKKYINIQFYIFKNDDIGSDIINVLIDKVKEGVEVRLLYDAVGSRCLNKKHVEFLEQNGVKTASFFPGFMNIVNFNLNFRNHRKIVVIDGVTGFVGGFNVGDEYLGRDPKFGNWRDTHIKIHGESINDLNMRFLLDWRYTTQEKLDLNKYFTDEDFSHCKDNGVQIVSSGPDITDLDEIKYGYLKMIQNARKYVYIQSPYLILDQTFIDTIKIASLSGVDVRIMIPSKPDHPFVYWASTSYAGELLKFGVKIYTYDQGSFLHAKTVVMDDEICSIGTANMDIRSFELNFEVNAFIYSEDISKKQRLAFENDIENSREITLDEYNSRCTSIRIKESISRLLSPLL